MLTRYESIQLCSVWKRFTVYKVLTIVGPASSLFGQAYYEMLREALTDDGVLISQGKKWFWSKSLGFVLIPILYSVYSCICIYLF